MLETLGISTCIYMLSIGDLMIWDGVMCLSNGRGWTDPSTFAPGAGVLEFDLRWVCILVASRMRYFVREWYRAVETLEG